MEAQRLKGNCGIVEISGLGRLSINSVNERPVPVVDRFLEAYKGYRQGEARKLGTCFPVVIFSDARIYGNGKIIAAGLKKRKLGKVVLSEERANPNSGQKIRLWIWYPSFAWRKKIERETPRPDDQWDD